MGDTLLDRPIWSALTTIHAQHAVGSSRARRFVSAIAPFGGAQDESDESLSALGALVTSTGPVFVGQVPPLPCPPGARIAKAMQAYQMHHDGTEPLPLRGLPIRKLGSSDATAMVELATLTNPGPFTLEAQRLGEFWGIEQDGRLAAMTGERFKQPGYTEISGVCTRPDFQGHGYARELCLFQLNQINSRGERAYLHVFDDNDPAIALYEKLGFQTRREINAYLLEPA